MPFSVMVVAIVYMGSGNIKLCLMTNGSMGAVKDEKVVLLL